MFRRARAGTHRPSPPAKANPLPTPFLPLIPLPFTSIRTPLGSGTGRRDTPLGCARGGQGPLRNDLRPPISVFSHFVWMSPSKPSRPPLPLKAYPRQRPKLRADQLPSPQAFKYQGVTLGSLVVFLMQPLPCRFCCVCFCSIFRTETS